MSVMRMVGLEIWHRKLNFAISLLAILAAVAYAVSSMTLVRVSQQHSAARVAAMDDEIRKITLGMGFNINILPADLNLADFHANDFAEQTMPYEYVERLAQSRIIKSVRHLRPALIRKTDWPEYERQIVLMGVSGVVPLTHASNPKKPLEEAVPAGAMILGHVLADQLGVKEGTEVAFHGHKLHVQKVFQPRGTKDDITVWINLALAQQILQLPGRINLIQALECNCASIDRLAEIQQEISQVLGADVQVIELATQAIARAQARETVRLEGVQTMARMQRRALVQGSLLAGAGTLWVAMLALINVRERRSEIGILRALGTSTGSILRLFLSKALLLGLGGALLGLVLGHWIAARVAVSSEGWSLATADLWSLPLVAWTLVLTPVLTVIASWVPAILAAGQDPAVVLSSE
jgi:ABC-type lipoprotein release transport system permease subunit